MCCLSINNVQAAVKQIMYSILLIHPHSPLGKNIVSLLGRAMRVANLTGLPQGSGITLSPAKDCVSCLVPQNMLLRKHHINKDFSVMQDSTALGRNNFLSSRSSCFKVKFNFFISVHYFFPLFTCLKTVVLTR